MCGFSVSAKWIATLSAVACLASPARAQSGFEPIGEDPAPPSRGMKLADPLAVPDDVNPSKPPGAKPVEEEFAPPTDEPQMTNSPKPPSRRETVPPPEAAKEVSPAKPAPVSRPENAFPSPAGRPRAKKPGKVFRGVVTAEEGGTVFQEPNFDAATLGMVPPGQTFEISSGKRNGFYRIRLKPGTLGWISDAEIRPLGGQAAKATNTKAPGPKKEAPRKKEARVKPINKNRYVGPAFSAVNYLEDTMGAKRTETLSMFGVRWSGPNTVISGDMNVDAEIIVRTSPPSFYQKATGLPATGFLLLGDFVFVTDIPQSRSLMAYYGFGPMFKFSQYNVQLDMGGAKSRNYNLTDINVGAVFALGVASALGDHYAVRLDGRYYWETQRYTSLSLALQRDF